MSRASVPGRYSKGAKISLGYTAVRETHGEKCEMGRRERYAPGAFCWVELETTDLVGSGRFYGELFGWEAREAPGTGADRAVELTLDGALVCGMRALSHRLLNEGVPPHWNAYVSVQSVDWMLGAARSFDGHVVADGYEDGDLARRGFIKDPTGAVLGFWEPRARQGAERVNDPGCFVWSELHTPDVDRASGFLRELFGWDIRPQRGNFDVPYLIVRNGDWLNAGILPFGPEEGDAPPHWLTYFTVTSCDAIAARAAGLGGHVLGGPRDVSIGRIAVVRDPAGAVFALFEGETDD
jgi:predicted enzyme related to lactoylglutathione lyase